MATRVQNSGTYELIETVAGNRILGFNGEEWYAWIDGQDGEILVRSDDDHNRRRMIQQGDFLLVDFEEDTDYRDLPHLFLGHLEEYEEFVLPNGLPDDRDTQKKIITTDNTVGKEELERYLDFTASTQGARLGKDSER